MEIKQYLNGLEIIGTVFFDPERIEGTAVVAKEIRAICDNWAKKQQR